jgi:predicted CoA-binding protein
MRRMPETVGRFLGGRRIAVAGVSRTGQSAGNPVLQKLLKSGFDAVAVNPHAASIDGAPCYPALAAIPGTLDGVVIATHPNVSADIVRQAAARGVHTVWFHRSFGTGSVSDEALRECERLGLRAIVGGCPLMYCEPVDVAHKCMRWILDWRGRLPA